MRLRPKNFIIIRNKNKKKKVLRKVLPSTSFVHGHSLGAVRRGKRERERGTVTDGALCPDGASHLAHQLVADRQPEAAAARHGTVLAVRVLRILNPPLPESKDSLKVGRRDAPPRIRYAHAHHWRAACAR